MIAETGLAALWLAAGLAVLQLLLAWGAARSSAGAVRPELVEGQFFSADEEQDGASTSSARTVVGYGWVASR